MNQRYDLIAFSLLAIAACAIAMVTIRGPIPASYEVLRDFQPIAAAFVALGAAALAYHAAMARVRHDQQEAKGRYRTESLIVCLRLEQATQRVFNRVIRVIERIDDEENIVEELGGRRTLDHDDVAIEGGTEFEDAWQRLDLLPEGAISNLYYLRNSLQAMTVLMNRHKSDPPWEVVKYSNGHVGMNDFLDEWRSHSAALKNSSYDLLTTMRAHVKRLRDIR